MCCCGVIQLRVIRILYTCAHDFMYEVLMVIGTVYLIDSVSKHVLKDTVLLVVAVVGHYYFCVIYAKPYACFCHKQWTLLTRKTVLTVLAVNTVGHERENLF